MGIEQSSFSDFSKFRRVPQTPSSSRSLSPLSEELPHSYYITGSTSRETYNSMTTSKSTNFPTLKDIKTKNTDMLKSLPEQITVVCLGNKDKIPEHDYFLQKLMDIPLKYPIMHSLPYPFIKDKNNFLGSATQSLTHNIQELSETYKDHCKMIHQPMLQTQHQLKIKIETLNKNTGAILQNFSKANRVLEDVCDIFNDQNYQSLFDVSVYLKFKSDFDRLQQLMIDLNMKLPLEKRLKELSTSSTDYENMDANIDDEQNSNNMV